MPSTALKVFISKGCRGCQRALEMVKLIRRKKPELKVEVVDITREPEVGNGLVVAVPTHVFDSKVLFLGNPNPQELQVWLDSLDGEV